MYDFGALCYLDVQKTGSTFIGQLLKKTCKLPLIGKSKHRGLPKGRFRTDVLYFNSSRNPASYYASLFNYGCDGEGRVFQCIRAAGRQDLYGATEADFFRWLDYVLDAENAGVFGNSYARSAHSGIGFASYRFLRLSVSEPSDTLRGVSSSGDVLDVYRNKSIVSYTVRHEHLVDDLKELIFNRAAEHFRLDEAKQFITGRPVNVSKSRAVGKGSMERYARKDVFMEKERLLLTELYP